MRLFTHILISILLFSFVSAPLVGQNLVPNFSFEEVQNLPIRENLNNAYEYERMSGYIPFTYNTVAWEAGSDATPDLRIRDKDKLRECERIGLECDTPHSGSNCVGIITYLNNMESSTYREYIQVKLKKPLVTNEPVNYSFWIAKERLAKLVSNSIGLHFSFKKEFKSGKDHFNLKPQILIDSFINLDKKQWVKIKGTYIPDKPYTYLMIGNFFDNEFTSIKKYPNYLGSARTPPYAYYLLDDIKIWYHAEPNDAAEETIDDVSAVINSPLAADSIILNYDIAKYELTAEHLVNIKHFFARDSSAQQYHFIIEGATDFLGSANNNQRLSEQRANELHDYVKRNYGKKIASITQRGIGELSNEVVTSEGDRGVRQHRRVLMYLDPARTQKPGKNANINKLLSLNSGEKLVLEGLNFEMGKTNLIKASIPKLFELRDLLLANPLVKVEIIGHVCCPYMITADDDPAHQQKLSEGRARNIYDYLVRKGVAAERLSYSGKADREPLVSPELNDADRQKNRRVELRVLNQQ